MQTHVYVSRIAELIALKCEMTGRAITVGDTAKAVNVSRQTMHTWMSERGVKMLPAADKQRKLEQFFGVAWDEMWSLVNVEADPDEAHIVAGTA